MEAYLQVISRKAVLKKVPPPEAWYVRPWDVIVPRSFAMDTSSPSWQMPLEPTSKHFILAQTLLGELVGSRATYLISAVPRDECSRRLNSIGTHFFRQRGKGREVNLCSHFEMSNGKKIVRWKR